MDDSLTGASGLHLSSTTAEKSNWWTPRRREVSGALLTLEDMGNIFRAMFSLCLLPPCSGYLCDRTRPKILQLFQSKWWKCGSQGRERCPSRRLRTCRFCQRGTLDRGRAGSSCSPVFPAHRWGRVPPGRHGFTKSQLASPTLHSSSRMSAFLMGRNFCVVSSMRT